jgi:putative nucleotidyltransferase with HDIG domain
MPESPSPGSLPAPATRFILVVSACGLLVAAWCVRSLTQATPPPTFYVFAVLTLAASAFSLKIPSIDSTSAASEIFALTSVLLYGRDAGGLIFAGVAIVLSLRSRFSPLKTVFNVGNLCLSGWVSGAVFFALARVPPLYLYTGSFTALLTPLSVMTAAYFLSNSGITATVVALVSKRPLVAVWRTHFLPLLPSCVAGASVALLLVVAMRQVHFTAIALILPLLFISYLTLRTSFGRLEDAQAHVDDLNRLLLSTVETLATAIDAKDEVTHDHVRRVQRGTLALARELGVTDEQMLKAIEAGALLHDAGKIAVPEHILNKPGRLTRAEFEKMKRHAPIGAEILSSIEFPYPVVPIVRHHHEAWDGTGYPDGLKGTNIPLGARILSVVDCYDALTSDRPYRSRMGTEEAIAILREQRGRMYDPLIVDAFIASLDRIMPTGAWEPHPAARAIGDARARDREEELAAQPHGAITPAFSDGVLAVTSLSRALGGNAQIGDVGALLWMILRQTLLCDAMTVSVVDQRTDTMAVRFAAGAHAGLLRTLTRARGTGISGWVAVNLRPAVNAEPMLEIGSQAADLAPSLRSCLSVPLVDGDTLVAVLSVYAERPQAYSDDHVRLIELLSPRLASALLGSVNAESESQASPLTNTATLRLIKFSSSA